MSKNVIVICATIMFCFLIALSFALEELTHDTNTVVSLISLLFTQLGVLIAALAAMFKTEKMNTKVDSIQENTDHLINGEMEAKIESVMNRVVPKIINKELQNRGPRTR